MPFLVAVFLGVIGCAEELSGLPESGDAGDETGDTRDTGTVEAPLAVPELPRFTPCPEGWREVTVGPEEPPTCDPWPEVGPLDCAEAGEAHFPGEPACRAIGTTCPAGEWADDLPATGTVLFVRADAEPGGDGTREAPFGSLADALAAAPDGAVVALGRGRFDGPLVLERPVTLWGACTAETIIAGDADEAPRESPEEGGVVGVEAEGVGLRNLEVREGWVGVRVGSDGGVDLSGVLVADSGVAGLVVLGRLAGEDVVVRGVALPEANNRPIDRGLGVSLFGPADVSLQRALVERVSGVGVYQVGAGSHFVLADGAVRQVTGTVYATGEALALDVRAEAELTRVMVADTASTVSVARYDQEWGVQDVPVEPAAVNLALSDVVILGGTAPDQPAMHELLAVTGVIHADRVVLRGASAVAWLAFNDAELVLTDVLVVDSVAAEDSTLACSLLLADEASATLERVMLLRNAGGGIWAAGEGTSVTAIDLVVRQMTPSKGALTLPSDETGSRGMPLGVADLGAGLLLGGASRAEISSFLITQNALMGVQVADEASLWLHQGELSYSPIGINNQNPELDLTEALDEVLFRGNDRNVDTEQLHVPRLSDFGIF